MFNSLRYLVLAITCRCNLHCKYCYQSAGQQGTDMSEEVIDKAMNLADTGKPLFIQITGGEPTLVPDAVARIVHRSKLMKTAPGMAIQTNGTLLTPELIRLFKKNRIQVGVSIDGPPDTQDELRGSADATLRGISLLEEAGVSFRVTTVVTNKNILYLDKLALMLAGYASCRGIGLDLLVEKGRGTLGQVFPASAEQIHQGITRLVRTLAGLNARRCIPLLFRELELVKNGSASGSFCYAAAGKSLAVQANGNLFYCGQTIGDPSFSCGSVAKPYFKNISPLTTLPLPSLQCEGCPLKNRCPGECPSRIHYNGANEPALVCELYRCLNTFCKE